MASSFGTSLVLPPLPALGDDAAAAEEAAEDSADADEQRHHGHEKYEPPLAVKLRGILVLEAGTVIVGQKYHKFYSFSSQKSSDLLPSFDSLFWLS